MKRKNDKIYVLPFARREVAASFSPRSRLLAMTHNV